MRRAPALLLITGGGIALVGLEGIRRLMRNKGMRSDISHRHLREPAHGDMRFSVVVPAYREERIGATVEELREALSSVVEDGGLEIVVVDDGSLDDTADRAERAGADQVLRLPVNRGKGAAVQAGMLAARGRTLAFTDADLSYAPEQLLGLLTEIEEGWDVVVGSRRHTDTTTLVRAGLLRQVGGRGINLLTRLVLLGQYRDTQCGLKAFRSDVGRLIFTHTHVDRFAFDVEIFHLVERYHLSLTEVPVQVENSERSTVNVVRDALRTVRDLYRIRAWSIAGVYDLRPADYSLLPPVDAPRATGVPVAGDAATAAAVEGRRPAS
jgi:glycosyltransferase involved in cell wall biosynthesis